MSEVMLRVADLAKSFGEKRALQDVHLELRRGEVVGFIGPNGAGKSTCLRCIVGLVYPSAGTVDVLGMDPTQKALRIRQHCCYLPGETSIYRNMTGRQFLDFALSFYPARNRPLMDDMLAHFDLPLEKRVRGYSAGMKQKLALLATLVPDVDIYLLDEPDRALDATTRFYLRELILRLRDMGKTTLLSTHHLAEVESVAHRLSFLVDGRTVPPVEVEAARQSLRNQIRLRLVEGAELPPGCTVLETEPDGTIALSTEEHPLSWIRQVPREQVISAEIGFTRLEDLYQLLTNGTRPNGDGR